MLMLGTFSKHIYTARAPPDMVPPDDYIRNNCKQKTYHNSAPPGC